MSEPKVILPDDLRTRILEFKAWMTTQTVATASARAVLESEITELEKSDRNLATQALSLEALIIRDADAAARLNAVNLRRERIAQRLAELQDDLAQILPPAVSSASNILESLISVWQQQLPGVVGVALVPFVVDRNRREQLSKLTDVYNNLRHLRAISDNSRAAFNPSNIQSINRILDRALAGRPLLAADPQE